MSTYATLADLYVYGLPLNAMGTVSVAAQQAILDARNDFADDKLRARYRLPLVAPFPASLKQNVCMLAAWDVLMARGYNPASGSDVNIANRGEMALKWFDDVERQRCHPNVIEAGSPAGPGYEAPLTISKVLQGWYPNK
jgi:phage gp36-like protein